MHVLIVGGNGQLGRALQAAYAHKPDCRLSSWNRRDVDISRPEAAAQVQRLGPDVVINAAAWTDVNGAEANPHAAYATNALGPGYLAEGCVACGACLVQISTNEVFAGTPERTYFEYDMPSPRGVYASSKYAGEQAASRILKALYIVRVAWLFGPGGNHFPAKIIAAADRHNALRVVEDEVGNPTYAPDLADAVVRLVDTRRYGIYHLVNAGQASRFRFAQAILAASGREEIPIEPISAHEWPRPAPAPAHAVLVNQAAAALGIELRPWEEALAAYLELDAKRFARMAELETETEKK